MTSEFLHNYDTENPNLKPCPFCGNNPVWHLQGNIHTIKKTIIVKCNQCGVEMKVAAKRNSIEWLIETIEGKWNKRSQN